MNDRELLRECRAFIADSKSRTMAKPYDLLARIDTALAAPDHVAPQARCPSRFTYANDWFACELEIGHEGDHGFKWDDTAPSVSPQPPTGELIAALTKLSNEVRGSLPLMEELARQQIGNTNYSILMQRAEEAATLLSTISSRQGGTAAGADWVRVPRDRLQHIADAMADWVLPHEAATINAFVTEFRAWLSAAPRPDAGEITKRIKVLEGYHGTTLHRVECQCELCLLREAARDLG